MKKNYPKMLYTGVVVMLLISNVCQLMANAAFVFNYTNQVIRVWLEGAQLSRCKGTAWNMNPTSNRKVDQGDGCTYWNHVQVIVGGKAYDFNRQTAGDIRIDVGYDPLVRISHVNTYNIRTGMRHIYYPGDSPNWAADDQDYRAVPLDDRKD